MFFSVVNSQISLVVDDEYGMLEFFSINRFHSNNECSRLFLLLLIEYSFMEALKDFEKYLMLFFSPLTLN